MKITIEQAKKILALQTDTVSLNAPVGEEKNIYLEDFIEDTNETLEEKVMKESITTELHKALNKCNLTNREKDIIPMAIPNKGVLFTQNKEYITK